MSTKDGGPAFPSHGSMGEVAHEGTTLRDWFAGQALAGIISIPENYDDSTDGLALQAYNIADAMLAARGDK